MSLSSFQGRLDAPDCVACTYYMSDGLHNPQCLYHKVALPQDAGGRRLDPLMTCKNWTFKHGTPPPQFVTWLDMFKPATIYHTTTLWQPWPETPVSNLKPL